MPPPAPRTAKAPTGQGRGSQVPLEDLRRSDLTLVETARSFADAAQVREELTCVLVANVQIRDDGSTRSYIYKSLSGAEAAVDRARARGRDATVTLCELVPIGEVTPL